MTVYRITSINRYIGLSSDTKPTGVPVGSEFFEYDSKYTYVCYDGTSWVPQRVEIGGISPSPSVSASKSPSASPSASPSVSPSASPSKSPSASPSKSPSASPSKSPSKSPSASPSASPS